MYTLGYSFKPWTNPKAIADGASILEYLRETATRARHRSPHPLRPPRDAGGVVVARTRAGRSRWSAASASELVRFTCNFLFMCSGYYDYAQGYTPELSRHRALPRAASCIRSSGPTTSTTRASASS